MCSYYYIIWIEAGSGHIFIISPNNFGDRTKNHGGPQSASHNCKFVLNKYLRKWMNQHKRLLFSVLSFLFSSEYWRIKIEMATGETAASLHRPTWNGQIRYSGLDQVASNRDGFSPNKSSLDCYSVWTTQVWIVIPFGRIKFKWKKFQLEWVEELYCWWSFFFSNFFIFKWFLFSRIPPLFW